MARDAHSNSKKLSKRAKSIVGIVTTVAVLGGLALLGSWAFGRADEQARAQDFYYSAPGVAPRCVYQTTSGEFGFSDHFMMCVARNEYIMYQDTPSGACFKYGEKSREQLQCIVTAEGQFEERARARAETESYVYEVQWRAEQEAKAKAEQAKQAAAERAIAAKVHKAIAKLNPQTDQERRVAALVVSCKYTEDEAGFRVAYKAYARASQIGLDQYERFAHGRYAICNESQVAGR